MSVTDLDPPNEPSAHLRRATVIDVAREAKVSIATVSRTFNNPSTVRQDLRSRVLKVAQQLGYSANPAARALRSQRTRVVGTVIPTLDNTVFGRMADVVQSAFSDAGYLGFLQTTQFDNSDLFKLVRLMIERGAEGLLVTGQVEDARILEFVKEKNIPILSIYSYRKDGDMPSIGIDNYRATVHLVDYVLSLGHTRVAMISGTSRWNDRQATRLRAFRESMAAVGLEPRIYELDRAYSSADGALMLRRIRDEMPDTTAVLCTSDVLALGVLSECRQQGISVPHELSVTGFDDFDQAALLDPPLTTIAVPVREIGARAVQALIANIESGQKLMSLCLDTNLIVRSSTSSAAPRL